MEISHTDMKQPKTKKCVFGLNILKLPWIESLYFDILRGRKKNIECLIQKQKWMALCSTLTFEILK